MIFCPDIDLLSSCVQAAELLEPAHGAPAGRRHEFTIHSSAARSRCCPHHHRGRRPTTPPTRTRPQPRLPATNPQGV